MNALLIDCVFLNAPTMTAKMVISAFALLTVAVSWQIASASLCTQPCPDGWTLHGNECLKKYVEDFTWHQAAVTCESENASLLTLTDQDRTDCILALNIVNEYQWIDMRLSREGSREFVWSHSSSPPGWTNWDVRQPNDWPLEVCAYMTQSGDWANRQCQDQLKSICEKPSHDGSCDPTWFSYDGHCYFVNGGPAEWATARQNCRSMDADLVVIESQEENDVLKVNIGSSVWIGLIDGKTDDDWVWLDGPLKPYPWANWASTKPDNGDRDCAYLDRSSGLWKTASCVGHLPFVCESLSNPSCRSFNERCYTVPLYSANWHDARDFCLDLGGDLPVIDSNEENQFLRSIMKERAWIGLNDWRGRGVWAWLDNECPGNYTAWADNSGQNTRHEDSCVMMYSNRYDRGQWANIKCDFEAGYICKSALQPAEDSTRIAGSYDNMYYTVNTELVRWSEARARCRNLTDQSDLAVILNGGEQDFINSKVANIPGVPGFWLGVHSPEEKLKFIGVNKKKPIDWVNWAVNEPRVRDHQDCVMIRPHGKWDDLRCDDHDVKAFICQKFASAAP